MSEGEQRKKKKMERQRARLFTPLSFHSTMIEPRRSGSEAFAPAERLGSVWLKYVGSHCTGSPPISIVVEDEEEEEEEEGDMFPSPNGGFPKLRILDAFVLSG